MNHFNHFSPEESMSFQHKMEDVLTTIAQRYIGANPSRPPNYRVTRKSAIKKMENHRYVFPAVKMFPGIQNGQKIYAWAKLWVVEEHSFPFLLTCLGPVRLYHNGVKRFGSTSEEESTDVDSKLSLDLVKGWNHFVLEIEKGEHGCGAVFGTGNRKNVPYHFLAPSFERAGEEGWIYTEPMEESLDQIPSLTCREYSTGCNWLPKITSLPKKADQFSHLYGSKKGYVAYAWTKIESYSLEPLVLKGTTTGPIQLLLNGQDLFQQNNLGELEVIIKVPIGLHDLVVISESGQQNWGFTLELLTRNARLWIPHEVKGSSDAWLYLGPFLNDEKVMISNYQSMDTVATNQENQSFFWCTDRGAYVRPFLENQLFGKWNYPLGVTMYGLLEIAKELHKPDMLDYVLDHVELATSRYDYSVWDKKQYGAAGINNQLSDIDSLDDCGSFAALMILANNNRPLKGARETADVIANYIMNQQSRLEDGAFYREIGVSQKMNKTMWCDDMYMSVPFFCRYAELISDSSYLDEAARQLLLYKGYLYMEEVQLMSHVYHVKQKKPTQTTWGRGNGWVLFSLTELLKVLPDDHELYPHILTFYLQLAEGCLKVQGVNGLWHQVLIDPESYEESSCTSMFMYAFANGVRFGWIDDKEQYLQAVMSGWKGLTEREIDKQGNIYGVCKGSSYSFSNYYYKHELPWTMNDTHGIGIVLLAGIETIRMIRNQEKHC
ncbi:glycoside hydrolase [Salipaludibacillus neizhouensis]|uniref:Glycoside hydrolase n=1 Tax=Salipaludibacillus neizhouensis TaxID=885475 RepID=A0A3A9K452_9BACI|nr:glycoside hydrolase family 88 protein [Salipaludibacillus neizhouensis]RKL65262.1 glycoside hydrolase [Salipaludibacillus neizhouensis]